jgi:hypothetical protein
MRCLWFLFLFFFILAERHAQKSEKTEQTELELIQKTNMAGGKEKKSLQYDLSGYSQTFLIKSYKIRNVFDF